VGAVVTVTTRSDGWDIRLMDYVDEVREKAFDWSSFECLRFANSAAKVQTGVGFADDWIGGYKCARSALRKYRKKLKADGEQSIVTAIDGRLKRVGGLVPPRGSIVARRQDDMPVLGYTLGVAIGDLIAFPALGGLFFDEPKTSDICWSVE